MYYLVKVLTAALVIVGVTELGRASARLGALIAALPTVSLVSFVWLYVETRDAERIAQLSASTFWLVLPTLPMFLLLPASLRAGWSFGASLAAAVAVTAVLGAATAWLLGRLGVEGF